MQNGYKNICWCNRAILTSLYADLICFEFFLYRTNLIKLIRLVWHFKCAVQTLCITWWWNRCRCECNEVTPLKIEQICPVHVREVTQSLSNTQADTRHAEGLRRSIVCWLIENPLILLTCVKHTPRHCKTHLTWFVFVKPADCGTDYKHILVYRPPCLPADTKQTKWLDASVANMLLTLSLPLRAISMNVVHFGVPLWFVFRAWKGAIPCFCCENNLIGLIKPLSNITQLQMILACIQQLKP